MHSFAWGPALIVLIVVTSTDLRNRRFLNRLLLLFRLAGSRFPVELWRARHSLVEGLRGQDVQHDVSPTVFG